MTPLTPTQRLRSALNFLERGAPAPDRLPLAAWAMLAFALSAVLYHPCALHPLIEAGLLFVFADDVEDCLGVAGFLLMCVTAILAGVGAWLLSDGVGAIQWIGSGAAGYAALTFYALCRPSVTLPGRVEVTLGSGHTTLLYRGRERTALWVWAPLALLSAFALDYGNDVPGFSAWICLAGAWIGAVYYLFWRALHPNG